MKTYEVTGHLPILGHKPGEKFTADLDETTEARWAKRGSIKEVGSTGSEKPAGVTNKPDANPNPESKDQEKKKE